MGTTEAGPRTSRDNGNTLGRQQEHPLHLTRQRQPPLHLIRQLADPPSYTAMTHPEARRTVSGSLAPPQAEGVPSAPSQTVESCQFTFIKSEHNKEHRTESLPYWFQSRYRTGTYLTKVQSCDDLPLLVGLQRPVWLPGRNRFPTRETVGPAENSFSAPNQTV